MPVYQKNRNMLIAEKYLFQNIRMSMDKHPIVSTLWRNIGIHPSMSFLETTTSSSTFFLSEKHIIERTMQYIKDRTTECFDDYFLPCKRKPKCKLKHMSNWFSLFIYFHNKEISLK